MTPQSASGDDLDYIQRVGLGPVFDGVQATGPSESERRLVRIAGLGTLRKESEPDWRTELPIDWLPTSGFLTGAAGNDLPIAFIVSGSPSGVDIRLGTWVRQGSEDGSALLQSMLKGRYQSVRLQEARPLAPISNPVGGLVLGLPTTPPPDRTTGALAIDRLIRAMSGRNWQAVVLAAPMDEGEIVDLRNKLINEVRLFESDEPGQNPGSLTAYYIQMLNQELELLTQGISLGAWRTAVYLIGDQQSYGALQSAWRSTYAGEKSTPEPLRILTFPSVPGLAAAWAVPDAPPVKAETRDRRFRYPFAAQTILTSAQVAAYIHLPQVETSGFSIVVEPNLAFDVEPPRVEGPSISFGRVIRPGGDSGAAYEVELDSLTRHMFVTGITGSGKTNTIFHLLSQAAEQSVNFLVIEPAKAEYRRLLADPEIGPTINVYTLGNELEAPFRLNPFEPAGKTPISVHIDLLRSVFSSSFGMWTPLPQILERCLHEIYVSRGWDLTTGENARAGGLSDLSGTYPTLADLAESIESVTDSLGYEERVTGDLKAALLTRIESLRVGGKGRMLDVEKSIPMEELLRRNVVLELEPMGDDDDKAFLMGLLLVRLAEHRRGEGDREELGHLLVIEEAHRLLSNAGYGATEDQADPQGKAVETFVNLLAEIRAYGQGVIVADQVPMRLAPEVIKNTGLKIAHRIVAADDRESLAGAMAMDAHQARALTTLVQGDAAIFGESDDAPLLVHLPKAKPEAAAVTSELVRARWQERSTEPSMNRAFERSTACVRVCADDERACEEARDLAARAQLQALVARMAVSAIDDPLAPGRLLGDIVDEVRFSRDPSSDELQLLRSTAVHAAELYARRLGAQAVWSYDDSYELADRLQSVLLALLDGSPSAEAEAAYNLTARRIHARSYDPFPLCSEICPELLCRYRWSAETLIGHGRHDLAWQAARDIEGEDLDMTRTWDVAMDGGVELVEWFDEADAQPDQIAAARRASLCFGQQMLVQDYESPVYARDAIARLVDAS